jgi:hypothetical protein
MGNLIIGNRRNLGVQRKIWEGRCSQKTLCDGVTIKEAGIVIPNK